MSLAVQINDYVNACFTGLWVQTSEPDEAEREILQHARDHQWRVAVWDVARGVRLPGAEGSATDAGSGDPLAALRSVATMADPNGTSLLLLHNFHRFLSSPEVIQTLFTQLIAGKERRTFFVVLSPVVQIPVELEKLFVVIEHALPDREQLRAIARELTSEQPSDLPTGDDLGRVLDAASGLTRYEAEGAFALSLARHNAIRPEAIWELKAQTLRKNNLLTLHRGGERFDSLGGLANLKNFCRGVLTPGKSVRPRGVLLLGVPGTGKSAFAKALGNETGRPTLMLDIGALMGSLVGETERNVRQALRIADAMSPCILFVDELEKGLSGVGGNGDSGVSTRMAEEAFTAEFAKVVGHLTERLGGTEDGKPKVFRDSVVENVSEFFARFRTLSVRSNDQLDELVEQAQRIVRGLEPQQLRDNGQLRQQVVTQLSGVQSVLDGLMVDRPRRRIIRSGAGEVR
jgi:hypothetical protein